MLVKPVPQRSVTAGKLDSARNFRWARCGRCPETSVACRSMYLTSFSRREVVPDRGFKSQDNQQVGFKMFVDLAAFRLGVGWNVVSSCPQMHGEGRVHGKFCR
jgi:hypothetical protein